MLSPKPASATPAETSAPTIILFTFVGLMALLGCEVSRWFRVALQLLRRPLEHSWWRVAVTVSSAAASPGPPSTAAAVRWQVPVQLGQSSQRLYEPPCLT